MNAMLLLSALRARYRLFLLVLVTTLVITLIVSLFIPKTYVGQASILLDAPDEQTLRSNNGPPERERYGYMQTQVDIITSPMLARQVVQDLGLDKNPAFQAKFESLGSPGRIEDWLAEAMLERLKVDSSQSSILQLSYASAQADMAAKIANAFAQAYVNKVLELRVAPTRQTSVWFNEQLQTLRHNMEQAQQRLADFQRDNGIVNTDERYDVESIQLSELATQIARSSSAAQLADSGAPTGVAELQVALMRAEARLHELSSQLGPRHPQYLRQAAEVDGLRGRIGAASRMAATNAAQAQERSRLQREQLLKELADQRQKVIKVREARTQMASLSYDANVAQRIYETAMQNFMTSNIDSHALQTNVRILDLAVPPNRPARPKLSVNMALALVVGTLLGLLTVYLLEFFDQRVRMPDDLRWDPQVPVLTILNPWNPAINRLPNYPGSRPALPGPGY